jgi:hypothetical protein
MIDSEVRRLRRLRNTALRARAVATSLQSARAGAARRATVSESAVACWRLACVVTGRLRAHPYPKYQQGPSRWRATYTRAGAVVLAALARHQGRSLQTLSLELRGVMRELDDARALTWSADLSDTFGRSQTQIRRLIQELDAGARAHTGSLHKAHVQVDGLARPNGGGSAAANWPYLAF